MLKILFTLTFILFTLFSAVAGAGVCGRILDPVAELTQSQVLANGFVTFRDLYGYSNMLRSMDIDFLQDIINLSAREVWLDGGSGEGLALRSYLAVGCPSGHFPQPTEKLLCRIGRTPLKEKASVIGITFTAEPGKSTQTREFEGLRAGLTLPAERNTN